MICVKCKKKPALMQLTIIKNGKKSELNLCEDCAKESVINSYMFENLITALFHIANEDDTVLVKADNTARCSHCGLTYGELSSSGKAGCDGCYEEFASLFSPVVKKIHGKTQHMGKSISSRKEEMRSRQEIVILKEKLEEAVQNENYEKAAEYRDLIKSYKQ